ncbi:hypothetical protein PC117_g9167 [Phytophthora cactorum]|uniref:Reverse transcriptase/retrotransposon-derived protein RNase H-like domain-containing protein n=2 Tax=Phytophthora cactorum TaxID=29920 RepID=A0A8T1DRB5_9STRA|nr:hypothetical protein PC117_g9167 [Phytophthora cactorum]
MAISVRLPPRGQALVGTQVVGDVEDEAIALVEGSTGLAPNLCVARSFCTTKEGKAVVEICNASTEEYWVNRGTVVASLSVVPKTAFGFEEPSEKMENPEGRAQTRDGETAVAMPATVERKEREGELVKAAAPDVSPDKDVGAKTNFTESNLSEETKDVFQSELNGFYNMFVESSMKPGRTEMLYHKIGTGDSVPIKQQPYRVSLAEGEVMESEIRQYLENGSIRPSNSPCASPVLMIRKSDGGMISCIDYPKLNAVIVKGCYPMPLIDDILDVLGDAQLFSTTDFAVGYWHVPMEEGSIPKTAFTCKYGIYEWLVLTRFYQAGFKLKMMKCRWGRSQVAFLGHIVTPSGILPNPEKVKAVMNVLRPRGLTGIRSFLDLTSYFRRYIPGYALISAPLELLKVKDTPFEWNEGCGSAFRQLKRALMKPPILVYPDAKRRFKLYADSPRYAVGACLMQEVDGETE